MTMNDGTGPRPDDPGTEALDSLFAVARAASPEPPPALVARIEADALAHLPPPGGHVPAAVRPRGGAIRRLIDALGGWPAMAGLATATVTGFWVGIDPTGASTLPDLLAGVLSTGGATTEDAYMVDTVSAFDLMALEG